MTTTSVTQKINKSWQKSITNDKYVKIWQYKHPKLYIITFHIHHQKWVLWQGKHFPIHWMKPCQMDWQKLVVLEKCILLKRILVISLKIKQNEKLTCLYYYFRILISCILYYSTSYAYIIVQVCFLWIQSRHLKLTLIYCESSVKTVLGLLKLFHSQFDPIPFLSLGNC